MTIIKPKQDESMKNFSFYKLLQLGKRRVWKQIWMIMRLTSVFIIISTLTISARGYSQKVSLSVEKTKIESIFEQIGKQTGYSFIWNEHTLKGLPSVSVSLHDVSIRKAINVCLKGLPLTYKIYGKMVYIERKIAPFSPKISNVRSSLQLLQKIDGLVNDSVTGKPLSGVTIQVKGSTIGTITDVNGHFSLEVPDHAVLVVSYLGYSTKEIPLNGRINLNVLLSESTTGLNQLVVVGYGTQKKITVTGAISSIGTKKLTQSPVANISNSLVGRLPGLLAVQRSGQPGEDQSIIRVRGIGTYAGSQDPLVLVDGIESQNYNSIDPNEIKSITILKDASATAVYGVRGANGVILITTKRGKIGRPEVSFTSNFAISGFTDMRENVGAYDYARLYNEALKYDSYITGSYTPKYTEEEIEKYKSGEDPLFYPDVDWLDLMFRKYTPQFHNNLSFSGGTKKVRYFASMSYFKQEGLFSNTVTKWPRKYDAQLKFNRYNFRSNLDFDVAKGLTTKLNLSYQIEARKGNSEDIHRLLQYLYKASPIASPGVVDGKIISLGIQGEAGVVPPLKFLRGGYLRSYRNYLNGSVRTNYKLDFVTPGLSVHGTLSYQNYNEQTENFIKTPVYYQPKRLPEGSVVFIPQVQETTFAYNSSVDKHRRVYVEFGFNYTRNFGNHNIGGMLLYNQSKMHDPGLAYLVPKGYQGIVGRVTYNYRNRYLAEFDAGYNGTENFAKGMRFGFFPAFSAGWVVSKETFFPKNKFLSFLKLRGSWGEVGNDQIGGARFLYLPSSYVYVDNSYNFGEAGTNLQSYQGSKEGKIGNPDLTWERARKLDIGVDVSLWENRIELTVDWFQEKRDNILSSLQTVPNIVAADLPAYNLGKMKNGGIDGNIAYANHAGELHYWLKANFTYAHNKILFQDEVDHPYAYQNRTGQRYGQFFGFIAEGFYNTWEEVNKLARPRVQDQNNKIQPGDIKYTDINGDGIINSDDMVPIGYSNFPEKIFGISFGGYFKGFDFSVLFQGADNVSVSYSDLARYGFRQGYALPVYLAEKSWTYKRYKEGLPIEFPHLAEGDVNQTHNYEQSTMWVRDASYVRLKNVEIGYTLNDALLNKMGVKSVRIYVNGNNLITWDEMLPGIDPESSVSRSLWEPYPVTETFNFGFKVTF